jgi:sialic acid synthase SpsE|tara:strand:- start:16013 stop:17053 length:1041 start_codon:yes stop_codon:yes gene_type:complete
MKNFITISDRKIGEDYKPLVIPEIGINHNGSLIEAKKIVDAAHEAGAEIIKHQTHIVEDEMIPLAKNIIPDNANESIYEIMEKCSLNESDEYELMKYIESKNMIFISTPFSRAAANRLNEFGVKAFKIGSGECNNYPLIKHILSFKKPMIISTGMNSIKTIEPTVNMIREFKIPYVLLHCTNIYPTPYELVRLDGIKKLRDNFSDAVIGLSDHTKTNNTCLGAVALGASVLERHFTDVSTRQGPDIICSMDKKSLKELILGSQQIFLARGGEKKSIEEEIPTMDFAFASVVSIKEIKIGQKLSEENIWVKRPGKGDFNARDYESLIGKRATSEIPKDVQLKKSDIN